MSSFSEARHEKLGHGLYRIVSADGRGMWFYIGDPAKWQGVLVPEGYVTDGPSIPSWLKFLLSLVFLKDWVIGCLLKASAVHDLMREDRQFALIEADCYFLVAMRTDQKNWSGPRWAQDLLREMSFIAVRFNRSRLIHNRELVLSTTS